MALGRAPFFGSVTALLGIACFSLAAIALATTRWQYSFDTNRESGLFESCLYARERVACFRLSENPSDLMATQAFVIMGTIAAVLGTLLAILVACEKGPGKLNTAAAVSFLLAGLFLLVGSSIYTGINRPRLVANSIRFGYSLWLSWAATVLAFFIVPIAFFAKNGKTY